ncbi:MAG: hypothetical protein ISP41_03365 [Alphaproteobacteria bacterium]|nr:hypothetical protein [Alphaproteobacteria bacterium]
MIEQLITWLFPVSSIVAGLAAAGALVAQKGSSVHRRAGRGGCLGVLVAAACVIWMSLDANDYMKLLLAALAGYLAISSYRALYLKRPVPRATFGPTRAGPLDKGVAQFLLIASCAICAWGMMAVPLSLDAFTRAGIEPAFMIGIGLFGAMLALRDMRRFRARHLDPNGWLVIHVTRMMAGLAIVGVLAAEAYLTVFSEFERWAAPAGLGAVSVGFAVMLLTRRLGRDGDPRAIYDIRIAEPDKTRDTP